MKNITEENIKEMIDIFVKSMNTDRKEITNIALEKIYENDIQKFLTNFYDDFILSALFNLADKVSNNEYTYLLLEKILLDKTNFKRDLEDEIIKYNKISACCADQSRTVINGLINYLITGKNVNLQQTYAEYWANIDNLKEKERLCNWKNKNLITYWSPKKWKNTDEVLKFIEEKYWKE